MRTRVEKDKSSDGEGGEWGGGVPSQSATPLRGTMCNLLAFVACWVGVLNRDTLG